KSADVEDNANIQGRKAESQAKIYKIDMEHANKVLITAASTTITTADVLIPAATIVAAHTLTTAPSRRIKGVKLERRHKASKLKRLKKVGTAQRIDTSDDTVMDDVSKQGGIITNKDVVLEDAKDVVVEKSADVEDNADIQGRKAKSQAE
nr:hypothetical protein [Tanacetum cinerariifolium]